MRLRRVDLDVAALDKSRRKVKARRYFRFRH
jgi:hypothetical protein